MDLINLILFTLKHLVGRLLNYDFNIEHISCANLGLVEYFSRLSNQKAKITKKFDKVFLVATITRTCDAIAIIYTTDTS